MKDRLRAPGLRHIAITHTERGTGRCFVATHDDGITLYESIDRICEYMEGE